ncbi:hypothetical protein RHMOL_Rhmol10G0291200 [Rhododendron molle]|uniref:Uncharacterized protein n=1 Tax=Rhododendron molle TaxID=49168 RepID=A0ACC0M8F9_RHOML|nr:hypothetical protein RHMOL_Rhmol10G0291200 [Rhododendron molle]
MGTAAKSRRKTSGFHLDLEAGSGGGSRGRYTIAAGCVLAPAGIGEVLVAWWLGMEVTPRRIDLSRGEAPAGGLVSSRPGAHIYTRKHSQRNPNTPTHSSGGRTDVGRGSGGGNRGGRTDGGRGMAGRGSGVGTRGGSTDGGRGRANRGRRSCEYNKKLKAN